MTVKILKKSIREYRKETIITPLLMVGEVAMEVLIPMLMALVIDNGVSKGDIGYTLKMSLLLILAAGLSLTFGLAGAKTAAKASAGFAKNLRHDLYYKIQDFSFSNIDKFSVSSLITRCTTDIQNVQMAFQMIIRMFVRSPIMFIFAILMVFKNGPGVVGIYAFSIPLLAICISFMMFNAHPYFEKAFKSYDGLNNVVQENLNGIRTVKAYVREEQQEEVFDKAAKKIYKNFVKAQKIMSFVQPMMMSLMFGCTIAVSFIGAKLINVGEMTTGQLLSVYTYNSMILSSLIIIGMFIVMVTIARASAERISEVLTTVPDMDINESGRKEVSNGDVRFENVNFAYKEGVNVLENINLDIKAGQMVGILGPTGSGKSTLVSLIARLYDATEGSVEVGNLNVKEYNLKALRDNVAVVLQKNQLFSGTVSENLRWGNKDATLDDIKKACHIANADSFVESMKDGYESHVEQGGTNFSGGQRQRLCIARALLKNPKVLIMDDSTSAVDTQTDKSIRTALRDGVKGLTKIIISQRISSVEDADQIIMMNNGRIEDIGTHDELLKRNSNYQGLYYTQTKGSDEEKDYE